MTKAIKYWILAIIMAILSLAEAVSGFVLWFGFPTAVGGGSGTRGWGGLGNLTFWELSKHTWIDIHNWVAIALIVIVAIHVILHWRWLVRMTKYFLTGKMKRPAPVVVRNNS